MIQDDYEMFKVCVIGSSGTGKSNICTKFIKNQFHDQTKSTIGVEFISKIVQVKETPVKLTLWDTAGQERYRSLSKVYYKGSYGLVIVYDVNNPNSLKDVQGWINLAGTLTLISAQTLNLEEIPVMIVGNKSDIKSENKAAPSQIPFDKSQYKFDFDHWEVSAKTGHNLNEMFNQLLESKILTQNLEIYQKQNNVSEGSFSDWGSQDSEKEEKEKDQEKEHENEDEKGKELYQKLLKKGIPDVTVQILKSNKVWTLQKLKSLTKDELREFGISEIQIIDLSQIQ